MTPPTGKEPSQRHWHPILFYRLQTEVNLLMSVEVSFTFLVWKNNFLLYADGSWGTKVGVEGTMFRSCYRVEGANRDKVQMGGSGHLDCKGQHRSQETRWEQLIRLFISRVWLQTQAFGTILAHMQLNFTKLTKVQKHAAYAATWLDQIWPWATGGLMVLLTIDSNQQHLRKRWMCLFLISHCLQQLSNAALVMR